jgi:hypothetical protein
MKPFQSSNSRALPAIVSLWAAIAFGLASGSVLADKTHEEATGKPYDKTKAPHEAPYKSEPPAGGHKDLAAAATNPLANLMQFQFQYQYNFRHHNTDDTSWSGVFQPVIPFKLPWASVPTLITRTTIPYVTTPEVDGKVLNADPFFQAPGGGLVEYSSPADTGLTQFVTPGLDSQSAFGDVVSFGLFLPKLKLKKQMIGIGPAVSLPLSSNEATGSGKWEAGPALVYVNLQTPSVQWGALAYQLWDVADSQQDRASVSKFYIQPFVTKHFDKGWYLSTQDALWSYDLRSEKWNIPLGLRFGKVTKFGKQPVNLFIEPLYQPEDNGVAAEWSAKLNLTLLIPK